MDECLAQPITWVAGRTTVLLNRVSLNYNRTWVATGIKARASNISSYNYLRFAQARGGCADVVEESITRYGISTCDARLEGGTSELHIVGEKTGCLIRQNRGFAPFIHGFRHKFDFYFCDHWEGMSGYIGRLNHSSIRSGVQFSGAHARMFKHNNMKSLEPLLREVISQGQPRTHRPWRRIS
ncbi:serine palmitoyltransferase component [Marasmius sp. AFHP31]|nr:serine palmitoyltransferase component [Marasmius sp. AFHP31]